jgi:hypothetical protein
VEIWNSYCKGGKNKVIKKNGKQENGKQENGKLEQLD